MRTYYDQLGRTINVPLVINRIVCLVPSITELLYDLGLSEKIIGRTKFCVFEGHNLEKATIVGGTKQVHYDKIIALEPDIIICNKEENTEEIVTTLDAHFPVYVSSIQTIHGALAMIDDLGKILKVDASAQELIGRINEMQIDFHKNRYEDLRCVYLIWQNPFMTVGKDTFIYHMLQEMGMLSVVQDYRYPEITKDEINESSATFIMLSNEPFPFAEKHKQSLQPSFPTKKILLVDGSYFSWYGSRLLKAYEYMKSLRETILMMED